MKKLKIIFFILMATALGVKSQDAAKPAIHPGEKGIFIQLTGNLNDLKNGYIRIARKENGKETVVGKSSFPANKEAFAKNLKYYHGFLPDFDVPGEKMTDRLWNSAQKNPVTDSLYMWGKMPVVALSFGYMFLDSAVVRNRTYRYVIRKYDRNGTMISSSETNRITFPGKAHTGSLRFVHSRFNTEGLSLEFRQQPPFLAAVRVFRKEKISEQFAKVRCFTGYNTTEKGLDIFIEDTTAVAGELYRYFVTPLDMYGLPGNNSDTVFCSSFRFPDIMPMLNFRAESGDTVQGIRLIWNDISNPTIKSIVIERSDIFDSGYRKIGEAPSSATMFTDIYAEPMIKYFYRIYLTGYLGEKSTPSVRVFGMYEDKNPPLAPFGLTAEGIENGVKLQWISNEPYIKGYYVFRSNGRNDTLKPVSPLIEPADSVTVFADTSRELVPGLTYGYSVIAENTSHIQSGFTDTVFAAPTGKKTLPAPLNVRGYRKENGIYLYWDDMRPFDETVMAYAVFRMENTDTALPLKPDTLILADRNSFVDKKVRKERSYRYVIKSLGPGKQESPASETVIIQPAQTTVLPPGKTTVSRAKDGILIQWEALSNPEGISKYNIYRYRRGKTPVKIYSAAADVKPYYVDKQVIKDNLYFYYVTSVNSEGRESPHSNETGIVWE